MRIGTPTETKVAERRVGLTPSSAYELIARGHMVLVQSGAGTGIGNTDEQYVAAGAIVVDSAEEVYAECELIVKVKEPQTEERRLLRTHHILFTYLHLAADLALTDDLIASGAACIAYETITDDNGHLPVLAPMSKVAGRMAAQVGASCLESGRGGAGILLGGVPGVPPATVSILGGGVVGENAAAMALGLGADVRVLDRDPAVLDRLAARFGPALTTIYATHGAIEDHVADADLVIGAVLVPGARAPHLVSAQLVKRMRPGSVVVDVAIDQGGCFETSHPTTHDHPTFVIDDVVHYCVANMPGAVARTSTHALNNVTLPRIVALADQGLGPALAADPHLRRGLNVCAGRLTNTVVAEAFGREAPSDDELAGLG
jgi:alanine dehydrogenase